MSVLPFPTATAEEDLCRSGLASSRRVVARTGVTYRQLDYWCRTGLVQPAEPVPGSGYARAFTRRELDVIAALVALSRVGMSVGSQFARIVAVTVRDIGLLGVVRWGPFTFDLERVRFEPHP